MAFSYNTTLSNPLDRVRFSIQDTNDTEHFFEDEEITGLLTIYGNNINRVIVECCYTLAALFSAEADSENVGPYSVSYKGLADKYLKIAEIFRMKSYRVLGCYAGGINKVDMEMNEKNKSIVQAAFKRNMMENKKVGNGIGDIIGSMGGVTVS